MKYIVTAFALVFSCMAGFSRDPEANHKSWGPAFAEPDFLCGFFSKHI